MFQKSQIQLKLKPMLLYFEMYSKRVCTLFFLCSMLNFVAVFMETNPNKPYITLTEKFVWFAVHGFNGISFRYSILCLHGYLLYQTVWKINEIFLLKKSKVRTTFLWSLTVRYRYNSQVEVYRILNSSLQTQRGKILITWWTNSKFSSEL